MQKDIKDILERINSGSYTPEEEVIAKYWLHQLNEEKGAGLSETQLSNASEEMWHNIQAAKDPVKSKVTRLWPRIAVAAAILLVAGAGLFFYATRTSENTNQPELVSGSKDVDPGKNTAMLILANGENIKLSEAKTGVIIDASKLTYNDGTQITDAKGEQPKLVLGSRMVQTPRGGQYQIILPDGSKVWLNAASSLKFPSTFHELGTRTVELSGEAYFEITKDKIHPFIVKTDDQLVEVLGTHFNINNYAYEQETKTTLLEGSVQVTPLQKPNQKSILEPGEQSVVVKDFLKILPVDVEVATAWKNGKFYFKNEKLESILNKIAYWYDVEIIYEGKKPNMLMTGIIERTRKLSSVLNIIELTVNVKFRMEGRKVYVTK